MRSQLSFHRTEWAVRLIHLICNPLQAESAQALGHGFTRVFPLQESA